MSNEKTFTVVGTAINQNGDLKMRWANDLVLRINILLKAGCEEINLHETPRPMTKLEAAEWLLNESGVELTPEQNEVISLKVAEKAKIEKRAKAKAAMTSNVKTTMAENKETDPRVAEFIDNTLAEAE